MTAITKKGFKKNLVIQFVVGAVVGAAAAMLGIEFGAEMLLAGTHLPGLAVAVLLASVGLIVLAGSSSRKAAGAVLAMDVDDEDDFRLERTSLRWQGIVTVLAAIELIILSLGRDYLTGSARGLLIALLLLGLLVQTWFNLKLWRSGDELFRRIIIEACVIGFLAFQFLLFFWVVGSRFDLVADPAALDIYVLMMVTYLAGSGIAAVRRGYGVPA